MVVAFREIGELEKGCAWRVRLPQKGKSLEHHEKEEKKWIEAEKATGRRGKPTAG